MFCQLNMLLKLEEAKQDGNPHPVCIGISMKDITRVKITAGPYQSMPRWTWWRFLLNLLSLIKWLVATTCYNMLQRAITCYNYTNLCLSLATSVEGVYDEGCDGSVALCEVNFNLEAEEGGENGEKCYEGLKTSERVAKFFANSCQILLANLANLANLATHISWSSFAAGLRAGRHAFWSFLIFGFC